MALSEQSMTTIEAALNLWRYELEHDYQRYEDWHAEKPLSLEQSQDYHAIIASRDRIDSALAELAQRAKQDVQGLDAPDSPGFWAFEGKSDDDEMEYKTVQFVLNTEIGLSASRDNELRHVSYWHGKWWRLQPPWDTAPTGGQHE